MKITRVLICHCDSLLGYGIESVFFGHEAIIVEDCNPQDEEEYLSRVDTFMPDVVIIGACSAIAKEPAFSKMLQSRPDVRVIITNVENNWLQIYQKHDVWLQNANDLIEYIQESGER